MSCQVLQVSDRSEKQISADVKKFVKNLRCESQITGHQYHVEIFVSKEKTDVKVMVKNIQFKILEISND